MDGAVPPIHTDAFIACTGIALHINYFKLHLSKAVRNPIWMPLSPSWTKQNYRRMLVMLTYLVIRLCLEGSKSSFQLTRSSNFMPSLACTHSVYGLVVLCVVVSSTLILFPTHFSPPRNLVWVYLAFRRLKIITAEAFKVCDLGLGTVC